MENEWFKKTLTISDEDRKRMVKPHPELSIRYQCEALETYGPCEIFNSDQGCQFTSKTFTDRLLSAGIQISMDGKGCAFDNILIERLWRTVKYEEVYLFDYEDGKDARNRLGAYLTFYNLKRVHQSLDYQTPAEVYFAER